MSVQLHAPTTLFSEKVLPVSNGQNSVGYAAHLDVAAKRRILAPAGN